MLITKRDLGLIPCFYAEEKMVVYMGELKVLIFFFCTVHPGSLLARE